jgi:hypothetical protein
MDHLTTCVKEKTHEKHADRLAFTPIEPNAQQAEENQLDPIRLARAYPALRSLYPAISSTSSTAADDLDRG